MSKYVNIHLIKAQIDENESVSQIECEESFEYFEGTFLSELPSHYAGDTYPICNKHIRLDRCLHYLIRSNHVEWHVPAEECTIDEYLDCFNEEIIELQMPTDIGGFVEALKWLLTILDIAQKLDWVHDKLKSTNIANLFKPFQSRSGIYIDEVDFKDLVLSKPQWKLSAFMNLLGCNDKELAEVLLKYYGYEKDEHDLYVFSAEKMVINQKKFEANDPQREVIIENFLKDNNI